MPDPVIIHVVADQPQVAQISVSAPPAPVLIDVEHFVGGGSGSAGPVAYVHTQVLPSTVWDIAHNLGFRPAGIHVVDADGDTYYPDVTYLDVNNVRLNLPESTLGTAYLS